MDPELVNEGYQPHSAVFPHGVSGPGLPQLGNGGTGRSLLSRQMGEDGVLS